MVTPLEKGYTNKNISVLLLVSLGVTAYCVWRFYAKRRVKKDVSKKGLDEQGLVEGEEEVDVNDEELSKKPEKEYLGKLQYELKYDFNTQVS